MNSIFKALGSVAAISSVVACGGGGESTASLVQTPGNSSADNSQLTIANDESSAGGSQSTSSLTAAANAAPFDLMISNVVIASNQNSRSISYEFEVSDTGGAGVPVDQLSVALEVAAGGSFADSYRASLFDIRSGEGAAGDTLTMTARSATTDLPTGNYIARLVVNPNWQNSFDHIAADSNHAQPFRYLSERDYGNNESNTFQISVANTTVCAEDEFENNDSVSAAQPLPVGTQISASLCLDDADFYSVDLAQGENAYLSFDYTDADSNNNPATRYLILDGNYKRMGDASVARETTSITINAETGGQHYLVLFGQRSNYRITRQDTSSPIFSDPGNTNVFSSGTISGPQSWLHGNIALQQLGFSEQMLSEQVINCGRITSQYRDGLPVAYVTPQHFADIHEFRFLTDGTYLMDGEQKGSWGVQNGDIANADWYDNDFSGYAERVSGNEWRYWSTDGLAYVECTLEINQ